jgi:hypothetical protein
VDHDDDVGAEFESGGVTAFLIAPIAHISFVADGVQTQPGGELGSVILRVVIDENDVVDDLAIDLVDRLGEGSGRVVGRHDDDDPLTQDHVVTS